MFKIQQITADPFQKQSLIIPTGDVAGTSLSLTIRFVPMQYGWFITNLTYGDFILQGARIVNSPNMLYQYRNQIPFGIACYSKSNREPSQQEDFSTGNSVLYLLDAEEVEYFTEVLSGQVRP